MRTDGFRVGKYCRKASCMICMGKTIILEFKKNGKANITVLALDLFLTVLPEKEVDSYYMG